MGLLLTKIAGLLVLAAVFGAWLARWWMLRRYEDVTTQYTAWQRDWVNWRNGLDARLGLSQRPDMQVLMARLDAIERSRERRKRHRAVDAPAVTPSNEGKSRAEGSPLGRTRTVGDVEDAREMSS
jgi:hypothetical protein